MSRERGETDRSRNERTSVRRGPNPPKRADGGAEPTTRFGSFFGPRWAVARRELESLRSEKTIVLALAIQLVIVGFSSFLVVGLVSLYDPGAADGYEVDVALVGDEPEELRRLHHLADDQEGIQPRIYDRNAAVQAFENEGVSAVLEVASDDEGHIVVSATAPDEGLETTLLVVQLQQLLETDSS